MSEKGTEQATPQRKKKARERGDGVRSRELLTAVAMLAGIMMLGATARGFYSSWGNIYEESLRDSGVREVDQEQSWNLILRRALEPTLFPVGLVMLASFGGALAVGVAQSGGFQVHPNALQPKFSKLNPWTNLQNIFGLRSASRIAKSLIPVVILLLLSWSSLKELVMQMPAMSMPRLPATFSTAYRLALDTAWIMLAWAGLDYAVEWRSWNSRLKMSKQELREEMRDSMGNPQIKGRVRQIQRAMRKRKVKADMSRASVVITNPTHYAVALEFSFERMQAPVVLAKGRDLHAAEIREEARWAGVPVIENAPLARSLYRLVEPGQSIPFELYSAVAGILAYLYKQKVEERVRKERQTQDRGYPGMTELAGLRGFGGGM